MLTDHPAAAEAAVIGKPDPIVGVDVRRRLAGSYSATENLT